MVNFEAIAAASPVMPVVQVGTPGEAVSLAHALHEGGVSIIEITLRTEGALAAVEAVRQQCPEMIVGAGTILSVDDAQEAKNAGAHFLVTPGTPIELAQGIQETGLTALLGVASPTEIMRLSAIGVTDFKLFPATQLGGSAMLKALAGPFPTARFCPTGGISAVQVPDYLALSNVLCVGGSWITPKEAIASQDWAAITALAKQAAGLRASS